MSSERGVFQGFIILYTSPTSLSHIITIGLLLLLRITIEEKMKKDRTSTESLLIRVLKDLLTLRSIYYDIKMTMDMAKDDLGQQQLLGTYFQELLRAYGVNETYVRETIKPYRLSMPKKEIPIRERKLCISEFSKASGIQFEEQPRKQKYVDRFSQSKPDCIAVDVPICGDKGVLKALDHEDISKHVLVKYKSICIDITKSKALLQEHGFRLRNDGRLLFLLKKRKLVLEEEPRSLSEEHALEQAANLRGIQTPPSSLKGAFSPSSSSHKAPSPEAANIFPLGSPQSLGGSDPSSQLSYHHTMFFSPRQNEAQSSNPQNQTPIPNQPNNHTPTPTPTPTPITTPTPRRSSQRAASIALDKEAKVKQNIARKLLSSRENQGRVLTRNILNAKAILEEYLSYSPKTHPIQWPSPPPFKKRKHEVGFGRGFSEDILAKG